MKDSIFKPQYYKNGKKINGKKTENKYLDAPIVDRNKLFSLISNLISCGFRGSKQFVVNEHIKRYIKSFEKDN